MVAINRVVSVVFNATIRAGLGILINFFSRHKFSSNQSGWHRNDSITQDHNDHRNELAKRRDWRNVSKSDGCQSYNCPINTHGNAGETAFRTFNHVH